MQSEKFRMPSQTMCVKCSSFFFSEQSDSEERHNLMSKFDLYCVIPMWRIELHLFRLF